MHAFDHFMRDEPFRVGSERDANLQELVHAHLALPVEHIPKPLPVQADPTRKFRNAHPDLFANLVALLCYVELTITICTHT